jgi:hypothetical protein
MAFPITEVQKALKGVDYPASKDELADHAERNAADRELGDALRGMARAHSTHQGALRVLQAAMDRAAALDTPSASPSSTTPAAGGLGAGHDLKLALVTEGRLTNLKGGLPIVVDGQVLGAVGVSSGSGEKDLEVARAGWPRSRAPGPTGRRRLRLTLVGAATILGTWPSGSTSCTPRGTTSPPP